MVIKPFLLLDLSAEYRSRWWVWSAVVRRPSEVYDTYQRTKLTLPDNARNNARCKQAWKTMHGLDWQHQFVERTPRGRVNQNDRGQR